MDQHPANMWPPGLDISLVEVLNLNYPPSVDFHVCGPQTKVQWINRFNVISRLIIEQNTGGVERGVRVAAVFKALGGFCDNVETADSLCTFREEFTGLHNRLWEKRRLERKREASGSSSTIGDEITRHFALDTLDCAMSIVNQENHSNGYINGDLDFPLPVYLKGSKIVSKEVAIVEPTPDEESSKTVDMKEPSRVSRIPRRSPTPGSSPPFTYHADGAAVNCPTHVVPTTNPISSTPESGLSPTSTPHDPSLAQETSREKKWGCGSQVAPGQGSHQTSPKTTSGPAEELSIKKNPIHIPGSQKDRAVSGPLKEPRQTRASLLRARANNKADDKPKVNSGKRNTCPPPDGNKSHNRRDLGAGPATPPSKVRVNPFKDIDPFAPNIQRISTIPENALPRNREGQPIVLGKENRKPSHSELHHLKNRLNQRTSATLNQKSRGQLENTGTRTSITSSLISTPGKKPIVLRVDSENVHLLKYASQSTAVSLATSSSGDFDPSASTSNIASLIKAEGRPNPHIRATQQSDVPPSRGTGPRKADLNADHLAALMNVAVPKHKANEIHGQKSDLTASIGPNKGTRRVSRRIGPMQQPTVQGSVPTKAASYARGTANSAAKQVTPPSVAANNALRQQRKQGGSAFLAKKSITPPSNPKPGRAPRRNPSFTTPSKSEPAKSRQPTHSSKKPTPLGERAVNIMSPSPGFRGNGKQAPSRKQAPNRDSQGPKGNTKQASHSSRILISKEENQAIGDQNLCGFRSANPLNLSPQEQFAMENPSGIPKLSPNPRPLSDISELGAAKNPRPSLGRRWLGLKKSPKTPTPGNESSTHHDQQKENFPPSQYLTPSPIGVVNSQNNSNSKSKKGITNWFRHESIPRKSEGSLFSARNIMKFGKSPRGSAAHTIHGTSPGYGFTQEEIDMLKSRLSANYPSDRDGFNVVGGKYYSSNVPTLDKSPSRDDKAWNPIAVCMELIHSANIETDEKKRESLFSMSRILVDAVSKSRDAECASEEAKMAAMRAQHASLDVCVRLHECVTLIKTWKADINVE